MGKNSGACARGSATRVVVESRWTADSPAGMEVAYKFTLRRSVSNQMISATVAGEVVVESADDVIKVAIVRVAPGRSERDALIFIPDAMQEVIVPAGLATVEPEVLRQVGWRITEQ